MKDTKNFVHLHLHSNDGSYMDATNTVEELILKAKDNGMPAMALTDHNNIMGWYELSRKAKEHDIKPLYGVEMYESFETNANKDHRINKSNKKIKVDSDDISSNKEDNYHSVFIAKNEKGMKAIRDLMTYANHPDRKFSGKGRFDIEYLMKHRTEFNGNVIWLSGCIGGKIGNNFMNVANGTLSHEDAVKASQRYLNTMQYIFGEDDTYLEIQRHRMPHSKFDKLNNEGKAKVDRLVSAEKLLREFAVEQMNTSKIQVVATNDVHYLNQSDVNTRNIATAMLYNANSYNLFVAEAKGIFDCHFKDYKEMLDGFGYFPQALETSISIADKCEELFIEPPIEYQFPSISKGDSRETLRALVFENGIRVLGREFQAEEIERLNYELDVFDKLQANDYFLILEDLVKYAKANDIYMGVGRGSAGGSFALYCLGIIKFNPLQYNLVFERFLNPDRVSMADVDLDFTSEGQNIIRQYLINKYGEDKTALIRTIGTWQAKSILNRLEKISDNSKEAVTDIKKRINTMGFNDINELYENDAEYRRLCTSDNKYKYLHNLLVALQDKNFNESKHAGGVVVSKESLNQFGSMGFDTQLNMPILEMTKKDIEYNKLTKFDVLAVSTLDVIDKTLKDIHKDDKYFDFEDKSVFDFITNNPELAFTLFQLSGGGGMVEALKRINPQNIIELSNVIAIYRPGAMDFINTYVDCKNGDKEIEYLHPSLEPILKESQGIMIYQEQVMEVIKVMSGFSFAQADNFRRAISNKNLNDMMKFEDDFIEGCLNNGHSEELAVKLFDNIKLFANYGFNKSHSVAYALDAFKTAKLLKDHPYEWYKNYITIKGYDVCSKIIALDGRVDVSPISVNTSSVEPTILEFKGKRYLDFGLQSIKGLKANSFPIVENRTEPYTSLQDFVDRSMITKSNFAKLACSGALDKFDTNRNRVIENYDNLKKGKDYKKDVEAFTERQSYFYELGFLGYSSKPLQEVLKDIKIEKIDTDTLIDNDLVKITGCITDATIKTTSKGKPYCRYELEDTDGNTWTCMNFDLNKSPIDFERLNLGFVTISGRFNEVYKNIAINNEMGIELSYKKEKKATKQKALDSGSSIGQGL